MEREREKKETVVDTMLEECLGHAPLHRARGAKTIQTQCLEVGQPHMRHLNNKRVVHILARVTHVLEVFFNNI